MSYFRIEKNWVKELDDVQSRELIARIYRSNLSERIGSSDEVEWGGNQRAADGGIDVWVNGYSIYSFAREKPDNGCTGIQVKAEKGFGPKSVEKEMAPKGVLRPVFGEISAAGGIYVIANTQDDCSKTSLKKRKDMMDEVLRRNSISNVKVRYLDTQMIADLIEAYPSVAIWFRKIIGRPLDGWSGYTAWAHGETETSQTLIIDSKKRIMPPTGKSENDLLTLVETIANLRARIAQEDGSRLIRIVGLSGVGKTRIVQAIFDERIETDTRIDPSKALYVDVGLGSTPTVQNMAKRLLEERKDVILIADNCSSETHSRLGQIASRFKDRKLRIITIEYDIRDDLPESTDCFTMEASSPELLEKLLQRKFTHINQVTARRIAKLSDGNARIAIAISDQVLNTDDCGKLSDAELFQRLFQQRNYEDNANLLRAAEASSLVYSFSINDDDVDECGKLAKLAGLGRSEFLRCISILKRRGLVQARGDFRALLPHALANRVAADALQTKTAAVWFEVFCADNLTSRLSISFLHRLSYLHSSDIAAEIAQNAFSEHGVFSTIETMYGEIRKAVRYLAAANEAAAIEAIDRTVSKEGTLPYEAGRLLFNLSYEKENFSQCAAAMAQVAKNADDISHNSQEDIAEKLGTLFQLHFNGTQAETEDKLKFVHRLLDTQDLNRADLAVLAISKSLKMGHFSSGDVFEFGSRPRSYGWLPHTWGDVAEHLTQWINFLFETAESYTDIRQELSSVLGKRFRGLWAFKLLRPSFKTRILAEAKKSSWPDIYLAAIETMRFDKDDDGQLHEVLEATMPQSLNDEINADVLLSDEWDAVLDTEGEPIDYSLARKKRHDRALELGRLAGSDHRLRKQILTALITKRQGGLLRSFGEGVAQTCSDHITELHAIALAMSELGESSPNYAYPLGFIKGWHDVNSEACRDWVSSNYNTDVWRPTYPWILADIGLEEGDLLRLTKVLGHPRPPLWAFGYHTFESLSVSLSLDEQYGLLKFLIGLGAEGSLVALDIIKLKVFGKDQPPQKWKLKMLPLLMEVPWNSLTQTKVGTDHDIETVFDGLVKNVASRDQIDQLFEILEGNESQGRYWRENDVKAAARRELFRLYPDVALSKFCEPDLGAAYEQFRAFDSFRKGFIEVIDREELLSWAQTADGAILEERLKFIAATATVFVQSTQGMKDVIGFDPIVPRLVQLSRSPSDVLDKISERLRPSWGSGNRSAVLADRKRFLTEEDFDDRPETQLAIKRTLKRLDQSIQTELEREARQDDSSNATFE